jgi:CRISPR-associated protein Cmr5
MNEKLTFEQQRAKDALDKARAVDRDREDKFKRQYRAYVERLGPAILTNGLGQAAAFEKASSEVAHKELYHNLRTWLCHRQLGVYREADDLLDAIFEEVEDKYLAAQAEAIAWLGWHKKFCNAYLPRGEGED